MSTNEHVALIHRLERHILNELSVETQKLAALAFHTVDDYLYHEDLRDELRHDMERRLQRLFKYSQPEELPTLQALLGTRKVMYRKNHTLALPMHLPPVSLTLE